MASCMEASTSSHSFTSPRPEPALDRRFIRLSCAATRCCTVELCKSCAMRWRSSSWRDARRSENSAASCSSDLTLSNVCDNSNEPQRLTCISQVEFSIDLQPTKQAALLTDSKICVEIAARPQCIAPCRLESGDIIWM